MPHSISVKPGTLKVGVSARSLLEAPHVKQSHIKCPMCGTPVEIPLTLEHDIRALAARLGGDHASILFTVHHPNDIPKTTTGRAVIDPAKLAAYKEALGKR